MKGTFMNVKKLLLGALLLLAGLGAHGALLNYNSGTLNALIPDGNVNGYQNTLLISGLDSDNNIITDVNVRLHFTGGYNGDLYVYLVHSTGFSVLLNRTGRTGSDAFGYGDAGFQIWLDDSGVGDIHNYGGNGGNLVTGTYQPDGRAVDPATVTDASARSALLSAFNGLDANGSWTLFVADLSGGDVSTLVSWELELTTVPEPTTVALGLFATLGLAAAGVRTWRARRK